MTFYLDFSDFVHRSVSLHRVDHLFTRTLPQVRDGIYTGSEYKYSLWLGREDTHFPPIVISDRDGYVSGGRIQYALKVIQDRDEIERDIDCLPVKKKLELVDALNAHGRNISSKLEEVDLAKELANSDVYTKPVPALKDPRVLETVIGDSWRPYVDELTGWNVKKDPRLRAVQKPHLLRGLKMPLNPHAIICTNGGTGKSAYYTRAGILVDRATRSSMTGFAKSPEEVFTSTMHRNEMPYAIDQIEGQDWRILDRAFNILEAGRARVDVGST